MDKMSRVGRLLLIAGSMLGLLTAAAFGAGFQIPEQGIGPLSMGMGSVGLANDLSAVYHNPAGLTQLSGFNASVTLVGIMPSATYTRKATDGSTLGSVDVNDDPLPVPALAVSKCIREGLSVALGMYSPYGLSSEYPDDGVQRYMTTKIALSTVYLGPYVAWQATPQLSVGAGVQYVYGSAELGQHANYGGALLRSAAAQAAAGNATLMTALAGYEGGNPQAANEDPRLDGILKVKDATDNAVAFNVGVLYRPNDWLQFGATYRRGVDLDVQGDVTLTVPAPVTTFSGGVIQSLTTTGSTTVSLPDVIGVGMAYRPTPQVLLTTEFNYHLWSSYENLDFDFAVNDALPDPSTHYLPDTKNPRDWDDTATLRLGAQYELKGMHRLRCGYLYDQSPMPNKTHGPELPMNDRNGITLGYGAALGRYTLDVAYAHLFIKDRTVKLSETIRGRDPATGTVVNPSVLPIGDYEAAGDIAGVGLSVNF